MKSKRKLASTLALCSAVLALAACGGGSGDSGNAGNADNSGNSNGSGGSTSTSIPGSATASVDSFVAYMKVMIESADDTGEPVSLGEATGPDNDTASPVGL